MKDYAEMNIVGYEYLAIMDGCMVFNKKPKLHSEILFSFIIHKLVSEKKTIKIVIMNEIYIDINLCLCIIYGIFNLIGNLTSESIIC